MSHYIKNEKLEKSFDNINHFEKYENNFFYKIDYINKDYFSFYSSKKENKVYQRPKSMKTHHKSNIIDNKKLLIKERKNFNINSNSTDRTPAKKSIKEFKYNNSTNTALINISNISINDDNNNFYSTQILKKRDIFKEYLNTDNNYRRINAFKIKVLVIIILKCLILIM